MRIAAGNQLSPTQNLIANGDQASTRNAASGPPPSYTGPLDVVPGAVVAYGQRAMAAANLGSPVYTIRRDSDDATQAFNSDATTGAVDPAAIAAFIGGGNGFITTWNDYGTAGEDGVQATNGSQPAWTASVFGSVPALSGDGSDDFLATAGNIVLANGAFTYVFVIDSSSIGGALAGINSDQVSGAGEYIGAGLFGVGLGPTDFKFFCDASSDGANTNEAGGTSHNATVAASNVVVIRWDGTNTSYRINGVDVTPNLSFDFGTVGSITGPLALFAADAVPASFLLGKIGEGLIYDTYLSDGDTTSLEANISTYYGI